MPLKPLDSNILDLVISASNRFVEAFEEKTEIEGKTNRKSVDPLICDYKFFLVTVFERGVEEVGAANQVSAIETCIKELFTSIRSFYLVELRLLTQSCRNLLKTYQGALNKNRKMPGLAGAPKPLAIEARIADAEEKLKEIEARPIPDLNSAWKPVFIPWNQPLDDMNKVICQIDEVREKIDKYSSDRAKLKWQKAALALGFSSFLFGSGWVTHYPIPGWGGKPVPVVVSPQQPPGPPH